MKREEGEGKVGPRLGWGEAGREMSSEEDVGVKPRVRRVVQEAL